MPERSDNGLQIAYRDVTVDGVRIAYREAGPPDAPAVVLLHGVPSSSRMFDGLARRLGGRYRAVAPDYPGFGNSDVPPRSAFNYRFAHLAEIIARFADALGLHRFTLLMQDYGAPIGMRLALKRPSSVQAMIFQNGNVYSEGLGAIWTQRREYWADRTAHEPEVRATHLSLAATRGRHIGSDPRAEAYDPDLWTDELAYLHRPGIAEVQMDLIYDYQHNIASYPAWQDWLRAHQLPTLVIWGRHDLAFTVPGAMAFQRDLPDAAIHILEAGHFAMDTQLDQVVVLTRDFLDRLHDAAGDGALGRLGAPAGPSTLRSLHSPQQTMDRFADAIAARDMTIFARVDHGAGAAEAGMPLNPTELIIFGNARAGTPLMQAAPTIGIDLPLKALVWQDAAGATWLGYNEPVWLASRHSVAGNPGSGLHAMGEALAAMAREATGNAF